ncbi:MAG: DNA cytosine methyltransferase, partial [Candidatus Omnitrophota bacterium]
MIFDHIDLFSGIGGFALAAKWAGIETVQFVEIDPFCQKVLQKQFPGVPIHDDIKTFAYAASIKDDKRESRGVGYAPQGGEGGDDATGPCDKSRPFLLTGGFPCQPYSCAGKRKGKDDDRALWPEMLRVISEAKPRWVIGENVAGFIGMGLDDCISDLEGEGYEVQAFVIPACAVNAPHRRDRVWIVANSNSARIGTSASGTIGNGKEINKEQQQPQSEHSGQDCHAADTEKSEREQPGRTRTGREGFAGGLHAESCGKDSDVADSDRFDGDDAGHDAGEVSQLQEAEIFRGESFADSSNQRLQGCERPGSHGERQTAYGS